MDSDAPRNAAFVSCDIVAHGEDTDHARQFNRIKGLNACIAAVCGERFGADVIWLSGGDGGHVALFCHDKCQLALELICRLYAWARQSVLESDKDNIQLRLTAHYGPVSIVSGADGRNDLVGDGINVCGALLKFGRPGAVLVTAAFRDLCEAMRQLDGWAFAALTFHREQHVYLKHGRAAVLIPLSLPDMIDPPEHLRIHPEKSLMQSALRRDPPGYWSAIYHCKRLLQVDSRDADALEVLESIGPSALLLGTEAHPLLSPLKRESLKDLIRVCPLVEREDGEMICAQDDPGDAMFIILKGEIGVVSFNAPIDNAGHTAPVDISFGAGQIVGELALALNRNRTAGLQAIGPTAFLSINFDALRVLFDTNGHNQRLQRAFNEFLLERSLRFLCQNCAYLAQAPEAPLHGLSKPWEVLAEDAERMALSWSEVDAQLRSTERFSSPGVYILAGGDVTETSRDANVVKRLQAADLPIAFVDLPNTLVSHPHAFQVDPDSGSSNVIMVRISDRSLRAFGPAVYGKMLDALKRQVASQFVFDAFISYAHQDTQMADTWRAAMEAAGLRVYMGRPEAMRKFKNEIELALAESLVMVPFVSDRAVGADGQAGWVQREIAFRRTLFDEDHCNILPIELTRGLASVFADGFSAVTPSGDGRREMEQVIATVRAVRAGERPPPYATRRNELRRI